MTSIAGRRKEDKILRPFPCGGQLVYAGVNRGDADANEDGVGAVVRSVSGNRGGGGLFYGREEDNEDRKRQWRRRRQWRSGRGGVGGYKTGWRDDRG